MAQNSVLPKYHKSVLENGLEVYIIPLNNQSNVITTDIFYKVGSRNETMGKSGIAHMLEHLNFKSTKNLKAGEFDKIIKSFGGSTNASTGFDYTHYYIKSSTQNLDKSLELFAELMQNLNLSDEEFQPERNVVAEERLWRTDNNPMGYLYFRLFNTAYIYHPYHWTPIGFMDDIRNWSIEDIRAFHKTYYQPKNASIVIAGDIEINEALKAVKKHFEKIPNTGFEIPKVHTIEPKQDGLRQASVHKQTEVEILSIAYKIPPFNHKDQIALSALSEILSGGKSSVLSSVIVDKKRLAAEIYTYNMDLVDEGVFIIMALANSEVSLDKIQKEVLAQIELIKQGKLKQSELDKVKINMRANFLYELESSSGVANLFGSYIARGDLQTLLDFEKNFEALSLEDIIRVVNEYFILNNATIMTLQK
ncbi:MULTISPECIES: M16 family metallopeptidase [Helicobacter]|uniref:Insulinase family protein n=1 Tax=Helicobacter colisuis TaxID=2949739 RepID=A0ABT0TWF4_9HELI|nr:MULTISPECIES: pitrilysin family protein [Helicobacter]MCI7765000.1 insulinase family protein [Helicobacter sp.]MCL9820020.1 insulinase family protein [Helicobacter colisuis]MDY5615949.1 pitrilysin family protein [Helicobacter sp.]